MNTREKILDTALQKFNQLGTAEVSTNHIAEACGISPGNLYYYFRNKQDIIRELFQGLFTAWNNDLSLPDDHYPDLEALRNIVETNFQIIWQYRFAYRELVALLRQDQELHASFLVVRQRGFEGFHELFHRFVASGILRDPDNPQVIIDLQELCWFISEFWLIYLEIGGREVNESEIQRGVDLLLSVIQPYLVSR